MSFSPDGCHAVGVVGSQACTPSVTERLRDVPDETSTDAFREPRSRRSKSARPGHRKRANERYRWGDRRPAIISPIRCPAARAGTNIADRSFRRFRISGTKPVRSKFGDTDDKHHGTPIMIGSADGCRSPD